MATDIEALRVAIDAQSESDLAKRLGVGRSAISQWKKRGAIPPKYKILISKPSDGDIAIAMDRALQLHIFQRPEQAYWLRAALTVMSPDVFDTQDESREDRGRRLERIVLRLMGAAINATNIELGQEYCLTDEDCDRVIQAMAARATPTR